MNTNELQSFKEAVIKEIKEKGYSKIGKCGLRIKFAEILREPAQSMHILELVNDFMKKENIKMVGYSFEGDHEYLYCGDHNFINVDELERYYGIRKYGKVL